MERTLVILKPDAVQRGLMGRILQRFEDKGLKVVAARFQRLPESLLAKHYEAHKARPFYKGLVRDRVKLANVDDIVANPTATKRWQEAGKGL